MSDILKITDEEIRNVLKKTSRQYFVGNLKNPQTIEAILDERLEIGISYYQVDQIEPAHVHSVATEYQYVISGKTEYVELETGQKSFFNEGDFYAIFPNTTYLQYVHPGTKILFIKTPSINDKKLVD